MPAGFANLGLGGKAAFILWCTLLGATTGMLVGAWRAKRRAQRNEPR